MWGPVDHLELVILAFLAAAAGLAILATAVRVPYPIMLVLGGTALGFVPGLPEFELDPEVVLLVFLPPLLYGAAFFSSLRDLRLHLRSISLLAIGLVLVTMGAVAVVAHAVVGMSWEVAFVLGAVVAPTDAVAPAAIARRLGAPRGIVTVIEGENLTNDWTALTLYTFAVTAAVSGTFELTEAAPKFLLTGVGGLAVGLAVGRVIREIRYRLDEPPLELTISLFSGYFAYLPAEALGVSGVIAAVTTGIYMGWYTPMLTTAMVRIQGYSVWEILTFVINALLFLLVGLQLPGIIEDLSGFSAGELIGWAVAVSAVVIVVRIGWTFLVRPSPSRRATTVIAWAGMRGAVSLAAALAIPLHTEAGVPFPERGLVLFLAVAVIFATLVFQGLTLGPLIERLGVEDDGSEREEETTARVRVAEAAIERLEQLAGADWVRQDTLERMRGLYDYRQRRFAARLDGDGVGDPETEKRSKAYRRLLLEVIEAERAALIDLRNSGAISDEVRRVVERELDLEESRLG